jgi:hypothetical protein
MNTLRISRTIAAEHRANESARHALNRCDTWKFLRRLKKLPKKPMSQAVLVALGLVTGTGGCTVSYDETNTAQVTNRPGPNFYVHEFALKDGTRCVISTSGLADGGTGVTCDWSGAKLPVE